MSEETKNGYSEITTDTGKKICCPNFKKGGDGFFVRILAYIANIIMIIVASMALSQSYGSDVFLAMLLFIPPILSILALRKQGDLEERDLKKRIRKAHLRRELNTLSEFDS